MKKITKFYKRIVFCLKKKIELDKLKIKNNSLNDLFNYFGTDKGTYVTNPYDKNSKEIFGHGFAKFYEKYFFDTKNDDFNLLEIGTWEGGSSASFVIYFPNAKIYGLDRNFKFKYKAKKLKYFNCDLTNSSDYKNLQEKLKNKKFKIIIDDGSHILTHIIKNLISFFKNVESGSYYIIEDFNAPEYYDYLNDAEEKELFIKNILINLKEKTHFKSNLLSEKDQKYLFENITSIDIYKGDTKFSDIAFLKKK